VRALSEILVGDQAKPVVTWRRYGGGRTAAVNAEGFWRLAMAAGDTEAVPRFWRALIKALVADAGTSIAADRERYRLGQTARVAAHDGSLLVQPPERAERTLTASAGVALLLLDQVGLWRVSNDTAAIDVVVEADLGEIVDSARRDEWLRRLADATGGDVVEAEVAASLGERLRRRADLLVPAPTARPMVPGTPLALLVLILLGAEWWLRRRRYGAL
jgi:hypothetical protein